MKDSIERRLIAKTGDGSLWLPLWIHHEDTCEVTKYLLNEFVSESIGDTCGLEFEVLRRTALFLALTHDIGKATVGFQYKIGHKVSEPSDDLKRFLKIPEVMDMKSVQSTPHALAGEAILKFFEINESVRTIIGAHHGVPCEEGAISNLAEEKKNIVGYRNYYGDADSNRDLLKETWEKIINRALNIAEFESIDDIPKLNSQAQMILSGLLITADWIASNTEFFPLISVDDFGDEIDFESRVNNALDKICFPEMWKTDKFKLSDDDFYNIFGFESRSFQKSVIEIVENTVAPGLFILEAPMGCGKTEAALACAEIMAAKCKKNGIFFGMPTQATANGIFPRIINWAEKHSEDFFHSINLQHGSSELNDVFMNIQRGIPDEESDSGLVVHSWFCDSKKACLANFVVATVDQMLMMALERKHVMLLHLGLSEKVLIIDEVHAYDTYMNQYLERALQWLGKYNVPVIMLSATLPSERRIALLKAYSMEKNIDDVFEKNESYPLLTWIDNREIKQAPLPYNGSHKTVQLKKCYDEDLKELINSVVKTGGCVGIIVNTVGRAQNIYEMVTNEITDNVLLYHARFIMSDRALKEAEILKRVGKDSSDKDRQGLVVIGTQVLEQSLDIDFDLLITDICPIDLLLQRLGRLHRHNRVRRGGLINPVCYVDISEYDSDESGSKKIYGAWLLKTTLELLPEKVILPDDISALVQKAYNANDECKEYEEYRDNSEKKKSRAKNYLLKKPTCKNIHGILVRNVNDCLAEASVRDGTSSLEVLVMKLYEDGELGFIDGTKLSNVLTREECEKIARQKIRLPGLFTAEWNIEHTIRELEQNQSLYVSEWQKNYLLSGQLFLFFDENNETELIGKKLRYDLKKGLIVEKGEKTD